MTDQMNGPALRDLGSVVRRIAERRADVISAYEVANLEIADEQLNRFANHIERPVPTREQIAEAISSAWGNQGPNRSDYRMADAVLALLNGADR